MSNSFATPRTVACQASLSKGFSQQEYWSGWLFHSPGALPRPRLKSESPALAGRFSTTKPPGKPYTTFGNHKSNIFFYTFVFEVELTYNTSSFLLQNIVILTMHFKMTTILSPVTICHYIKILVTAYIPHPLHGSLPCCG